MNKMTNINLMALGIQQVPPKSLNHSNSSYLHKYSTMVKIRTCKLFLWWICWVSAFNDNCDMIVIIDSKMSLTQVDKQTDNVWKSFK